MIPVKELAVLLEKVQRGAKGCSGKLAEDLLNCCAHATAKAREAWAFALLSESGKEALSRYFTYQFRQVSSILDAARSLEEGGGGIMRLILDLSGHLYLYFNEFPDRNLGLHPDFCRQQLDTWKGRAEKLHVLLADRSVDAPLKELLDVYLSHLFNTKTELKLSIGELSFAEKFLEESIDLLSSLPVGQDAGQCLVDHLMFLNFNALSFFSYLQGRLRSQVDLYPVSLQVGVLRSYMPVFTPLPKEPVFIYNSRWPGLRQMVRDWLVTEVSHRERLEAESAKASERAGTMVKLFLDLSMAHLAFLTRLFFEEGIFGGGKSRGSFKVPHHPLQYQASA